MAGFDTSGRVRRGVITPRGVFSFRPGFVRWTDLNPFTQGYVEALFRSCLDDGGLLRIPFSSGSTFCSHYGITFSDLAAETLARIMEDCEGCGNLRDCVHSDLQNKAEIGAQVWRDRQAGRWAEHGFPPLTPYLGDDGRVYLRDAPSPSSDRGGS